jgi:hypothetical protein
MATASSVTGVGQGSADKAGQKGSEHLFVGVEKLIGPRVVLAGKATVGGGGSIAVTFPTTLPGVAGDYVALATSTNATAHATNVSALSTTALTIVGTASDVVNYIVVRVNNATVTVG